LIHHDYKFIADPLRCEREGFPLGMNQLIIIAKDATWLICTSLAGARFRECHPEFCCI